MNAVNAVQLFLLVWTFSAVCQTDGDFIVSCDNVTGSVGKEATFTCSISPLPDTNCCVKSYKFQYPIGYDDSAICKEEFPVNTCDHRDSFKCRYTPTTAMTEQFRFFVQTKCGMKRTEFTVNITEDDINKNPLEASAPDTEVNLGSKVFVIAAVVGCFIIIIMVIMKVIRNKKPNFNRSCGFQKRMFMGLRYDKDNSNHSEDVINDSGV